MDFIVLQLKICFQDEEKIYGKGISLFVLSFTSSPNLVCTSPLMPLNYRKHKIHLSSILLFMGFECMIGS